jgi:SanA protein
LNFRYNAEMNEAPQIDSVHFSRLLQILRNAILCFFFVTLSISLATTLVARSHIYHDYADMPQRQIAVVFGTSPFAAGGEPNSYFLLRMNTAAGLYHAGKIEQIIVTGDNRAVNYNEPRAMRKALLDRGVPKEVIHEDYAGRDTLDSVLRARDVFGVMEPLYITQRFHADRAITMALWHGIPAEAYVVPETGGLYIRTKLYIREYFARMKMAAELLMGAVPAIAGKFDPVRKHEVAVTVASSTVATTSVNRK